jgi:hypothetical protein
LALLKSACDKLTDVLDSLETGRAEAVHGVGWGGVWNAGSESSGTNLVGSVGLDDVAKDDIVDERWVDLGLVEGVLDHVEDELIWEGILESTTASLGERSTDGGGDDNVVWVLRGAGNRV